VQVLFFAYKIVIFAVKNIKQYGKKEKTENSNFLV
jgi:hypothetical protein